MGSIARREEHEQIHLFSVRTRLSGCYEVNPYSKVLKILYSINAISDLDQY